MRWTEEGIVAEMMVLVPETTRGVSHGPQDGPQNYSGEAYGEQNVCPACRPQVIVRKSRKTVAHERRRRRLQQELAFRLREFHQRGYQLLAMRFLDHRLVAREFAI
jgi:hypothetical protein